MRSWCFVSRIKCVALVIRTIWWHDNRQVLGIIIPHFLFLFFYLTYLPKVIIMTRENHYHRFPSFLVRRRDQTSRMTYYKCFKYMYLEPYSTGRIFNYMVRAQLSYFSISFFLPYFLPYFLCFLCFQTFFVLYFFFPYSFILYFVRKQLLRRSIWRCLT